jgi:hypothetical protein
MPAKAGLISIWSKAPCFYMALFFVRVSMPIEYSNCEAAITDNYWTYFLYTRQDIGKPDIFGSTSDGRHRKGVVAKMPLLFPFCNYLLQHFTFRLIYFPCGKYEECLVSAPCLNPLRSQKT